MSSIRNIITYFKDCFEAEQQGAGIWNFFSSKVEEPYVIPKKEEHLTGFLPHLPVPPDAAESFYYQTTIYKKEKELVYTSFFILGYYTDVRGKQRRLMAPVMIYPTEIFSEGDHHYIKAALDEGYVNPAILDILNQQNASITPDEVHEQLSVYPYTDSAAARFTRALDTWFSSLNSTYMLDYPKIYSASKLKGFFGRELKDTNYMLVPGSAAGIIRRSVSLRNVISELDTLSKRIKNYSPPILSLFDPSYRGADKMSKTPIFAPSVLSAPQEGAIRAAHHYPLSVVIGPPGTGKSYTIASLAIDLMSKGKNVLIASRMDGAVGVVEDKIEEMLGEKGMCVRGGRKDYKKKLKNRLQLILSRGSISRSRSQLKKGPDYFDLNTIRNDLKLMSDSIHRMENKFEDLEWEELEKGKLMKDIVEDPNFWNFIKEKWIGMHRWISKPEDVTSLIDGYLQGLTKKNETTIQYVRDLFNNRIHQAVIDHRNVLRNFLKSLRASDSARQQSFFSETDHDKLFWAFPIWLVNLKDVGEVLPLENQLFDVVIIDEASQCDIATALPALQRAKKAVIVGDPRQLRHLSFLSRQWMHRLKKKHHLIQYPDEKLSYRDTSLLDLAEQVIEEPSQINLLNEHYRSVPEIIRFSNERFYLNELSVMTNRNRTEQSGLKWVPVNGERNQNGSNPVEAKSIIEWLRKRIDEEKKDPNRIKSSIGILSPFRSQVDYINVLLQENFKVNELGNHEVIAGTAHSFQGEERDVMCLSIVLDNRSPAASYYFLNKEDVFNVSITHARNEQLIFYSFEPENLPMESLLRSYYDSADFADHKRRKRIKEDHFLREVRKFVEEEGYTAKIAFSVAGTEIDLLVMDDKDHCVGLDLIGYPGEFQEAIPLYKYKALFRIQIPLLPITYTKWHYQNEEYKIKISQLLKERMLPLNLHE